MFDEYSQWFQSLQDTICNTIEDLDCNMTSHKGSSKKEWDQFHRTIYLPGVYQSNRFNF